MVEIWEIHARLTRAVSADLHDTTSVRPNMDGRYTPLDGTMGRARMNQDSRMLSDGCLMIFPPISPRIITRTWR